MPLQSAGAAKLSSGGVSASATSGMALRKAVNHPYHYLSRLPDLEAEVWWTGSVSLAATTEQLKQILYCLEDPLNPWTPHGLPEPSLLVPCTWKSLTEGKKAASGRPVEESLTGPT